MSLKTNELSVAEYSDSIKFLNDSDTDGTCLSTVGTMQEDLDDVFYGSKLYQGKELTDTWANLKTKIDAGNFAGIHIGDWKTVTINDEEVVMEVAGIDTYYKCGDKEIKHHVDFISRDCLKTPQKFNDTETNNANGTTKSPFVDSALSKFLNTDSTGLIEKLPEELKTIIITKRALVETRSGTGTTTASTSWGWQDMGKLWVPTEREVFGDAIWGEESWSGGGGCNIQYPIFDGHVNHRIKHQGKGSTTAVDWWTASAVRSNAKNICTVDKQGSATSAAANSATVYVPICFRIGTATT